MLPLNNAVQPIVPEYSGCKTTSLFLLFLWTFLVLFGDERFHVVVNIDVMPAEKLWNGF